MTPVTVKAVSNEWEPSGDILIIYYHLTNGRKVSVMITKSASIHLGGADLTGVVAGMVQIINKQLALKVPVGYQWNTFISYIRDEFITAVDQILHIKKNQAVAEWGIFPDDLAPHEEHQPRVLRLIDLGEGMLVPKDFVEKILNDAPSGVLSYVDDFVKEVPDPKKYFQSQYLQYLELKGPQPGPDKQLIPKPTPGQTYKAHLSKIKKFL